MSRAKDRQRAKTIRYRSGQRVEASVLDKEYKAKKQAKTDQHLAKLGLVKGKANIVLPKGVKQRRKPNEQGS